MNLYLFTNGSALSTNKVVTFPELVELTVNSIFLFWEKDPLSFAFLIFLFSKIKLPKKLLTTLFLSK